MAVGAIAVTYGSVVDLCSRLQGGRCCMLHHLAYLPMQHSAEALMLYVVDAAGWEAQVAVLIHPIAAPCW